MFSGALPSFHFRLANSILIFFLPCPNGNLALISQPRLDFLPVLPCWDFFSLSVFKSLKINRLEAPSLSSLARALSRSQSFLVNLPVDLDKSPPLHRSLAGTRAGGACRTDPLAVVKWDLQCRG